MPSGGGSARRNRIEPGRRGVARWAAMKLGGMTVLGVLAITCSLVAGGMWLLEGRTLAGVCMLLSAVAWGFLLFRGLKE